MQKDQSKKDSTTITPDASKNAGATTPEPKKLTPEELLAAAKATTPDIKIDKVAAVSTEGNATPIYMEHITLTKQLFPELEEKVLNSYTAFYFQGRKVLNINHDRSPKAYFFFPGCSQVAKALAAAGTASIREITTKEAQEKRHGAARAVYTSAEPIGILQMLTVWQNNFNPAKPAAAAPESK